jgi:Tfp pilus assembly major pilin PilA
MTVVAIVCILAVVGVSSYRSYTIRASVAALIPTADKVKNAVEDAHNQGTVFGTSGNQTYISSSVANKPYAMLDVIRVNYGCVNIDVDLNALNLDTSKQLTIMWCPTVNNGSIEWRCGYTAASYSAYITYLPANCQNTSASITDTTF